MFELTKAVVEQAKIWIDQNTPLAKNKWITALEGDCYIRYINVWRQLDLANFDLEYRRRGVAAEIIRECVGLDLDCIKVENIMIPEWGEVVRNYSFDGYDTTVNEGLGTLTVKYRKIKHGR